MGSSFGKRFFGIRLIIFQHKTASTLGFLFKGKGVLGKTSVSIGDTLESKKILTDRFFCHYPKNSTLEILHTTDSKGPFTVSEVESLRENNKSLKPIKQFCCTPIVNNSEKPVLKLTDNLSSLNTKNISIIPFSEKKVIKSSILGV